MKAIGDVETKRKFTAVANGAITSGDPCVIESAGTVAAVAESESVLSTPTFNSEQDFQSGGGAYLSSVSIGSNKFILTWRDPSGVLPMKAVVGEIDSANNTISYGTTVTYDTPSSFGGATEVVWDSDNSKFAIFYYINNATMKVVIGTVSGTTLSFGTAVTYETSFYNQPCASYAGNGKFIVYHHDTNNSNYLVGYGVSVSGTTPTVGTKTTLDSASIQLTRSAVWNDTAERSVIFYRTSSIQSAARVVKITTGTTLSVGAKSSSFGGQAQQAPYGAAEVTGTKNVLCATIREASGYGAMVTVGTIDDSTETISLSSDYVFLSYADGYTSLAYSSVGYDPVTGAVLAVCRDNNATGDESFAVLGTLSGTTITFGSEAGYTDQVTGPRYANVKYDVASGRFVIFWEYTNTDMTGLVVNHTALATNVTAENFIGFADAGYADGADASVELSGLITREQSGLTAGQKYYVQNDGSLGTTADDPSVVAGTAISATELIVKG